MYDSLVIQNRVVHPDKCTGYPRVIFLPAVDDRPLLQYLSNFDLIRLEPFWC